MGEVWRGRHRLLARAAAVKLIRPELLASSHTDPALVLRRFEREALATAAVPTEKSIWHAQRELNGADRRFLR